MAMVRQAEAEERAAARARAEEEAASERLVRQLTEGR